MACHPQSLEMGMNTAEFVHWTLLDSRYVTVGDLLAEEGETATMLGRSIPASRLTHPT